MKQIIIMILAAFMSVASFAQPKSSFSTDKFDTFTLHTYASFDAMADVSFIVETKNSLVIIEPQAFKGKVEEFQNYTQKLNKPIKKVLVSFHAAGLKVYKSEHKVITKPMAEFMKTEAAKGMLAFFSQAFKGAMDTEVVEFDEEIEANSSFDVEEVEFRLEPTQVPGMPGVNIAIGNQVYYQHFAPAKGMHVSKNWIKSKAAIQGALADAQRAKKGNYKLFLGSHGFGKAGKQDLKFQINYLKTMKKLAKKATSAKQFVKLMNKKYPNCKGKKDLKAIAQNLYK
ncbi:MAG: hypothetical protein N4A49_02735 [Marinifilaceae bacterium]|jgi:hypothetical protein|nr:hypothetical protein [Marinifilaceae bacterium]